MNSDDEISLDRIHSDMIRIVRLVWRLSELEGVSKTKTNTAERSVLLAFDEIYGAFAEYQVAVAKRVTAAAHKEAAAEAYMIRCNRKSIDDLEEGDSPPTPTENAQ